MSTLGQGPSLRKNPSSTMERTLLGMDVAKDKGGNLPLVVTLQVIPWNRKSTKAKKDNRENGNVRGKGCHDFISALYLTQPCFSAFTTTPNNWRGGLMGQVPTLGGTTIKGEWRETERGG